MAKIVGGEEAWLGLESDKPHEACGLVGVYSDSRDPQTVDTVLRALRALQHRGQDGAGIGIFDGEDFYVEKEAGYVNEVLKEREIRTLTYASKGTVTLGHTRYGTSGKNEKEKDDPLAQPFVRKHIMLEHNGHSEDVEGVARSLGYDVAGCRSDSEGITCLVDDIAEQRGDVVEALHIVWPKLNGANNALISEPDRLIGVIDSAGYRPLSIGELPNGDTILASETVAFDAVGARFIRDVERGEIVIVDKDGLHSERLSGLTYEQFCMFEYIYFAHPNSLLRGKNVYEVRKRLGQLLAVDHPVEADGVVGLLNSGGDYAKGYSRQSGIPEEGAIPKNPYIARTFISQELGREDQVHQKHPPNRYVIEGKKWVVVDDSIVRSTTAKETVDTMWAMGAHEVHLRIPSPPYAWPCYYGMNTPEPNELVAHGRSIEEITDYVGATSLEYLSLDRVIEGINSVRTVEPSHLTLGSMCTSCATGIYPTEVPVTIDKRST